MKIFGIGLSKTGTTSLARALEILEFTVKDCLGVTTYTKGDISSIDSNALATYDAFTDTPIPSFFQELDKLYPDAKFVLTVREMDGWLNSCKKQFNQKLAQKRSDAANQLFLDLYDTVTFDENKFREAYKIYVDGVLKYFENRPNDLLVIDIAKGDGWEKLCPFLNKPLQTTLFPKSNVTQIKWLNVHQLASSIRQKTLKSDNLFNNILCILFSFSRKRRIRLTTRKLELLVSEELIKLNANIPIISKNKHNIPLKIRKDWHHYWLIDCSEEEYLLDDNSFGHIVNVALVEDGKPYIGIVYSSRDDILYYAALDKGAFKIVDHQKPIKMSTDTLNATQNVNHHLQNTSNPGYLLCQLAEIKDFGDVTIEGSKDWNTAAGHAILLSLGMNLMETSNKKIVKYNKTNWINPDLKIIK